MEQKTKTQKGMTFKITNKRWRLMPLSEKEYDSHLESVLKDCGVTKQEYLNYMALKDKFEPIIKVLKDKASNTIYTEKSPWYYLPLSDHATDVIEIIKDYYINSNMSSEELSFRNSSNIENVSDEELYKHHLFEEKIIGLLFSFNIKTISVLKKGELLKLEGVTERGLKEIEICLNKLNLKFS